MSRAFLLRSRVLLAGQVIAEEVLPHVILGLFLLIFVQVWLILRDSGSFPDSAVINDAPATSDGLASVPSSPSVASGGASGGASGDGVRRRNKGKKAKSWQH